MGVGVPIIRITIQARVSYPPCTMSMRGVMLINLQVANPRDRKIDILDVLAGRGRRGDSTEFMPGDVEPDNEIAFSGLGQDNTILILLHWQSILLAIIEETKPHILWKFTCRNTSNCSRCTTKCTMHTLNCTVSHHYPCLCLSHPAFINFCTSAQVETK